MIWKLDSVGLSSIGISICIIVGEELQILTYAWHSWPLSSEGSLACYTYCDTGHRLQWSSPRTRDTRAYCWAFGNGAVTTYFNDGPVAVGIRILCLQGKFSNWLRHCQGYSGTKFLLICYKLEGFFFEIS